MNLQKWCFLAFLLLMAPRPARAQETPPPDLQNSRTDIAKDFSKTVLPIHEFKYRIVEFEVDFGTGFCLDPECRFIVTNYHTAQIAKPASIAGQKIIARHYATGPDDEGATTVHMLSRPPMRFTYARDLALFELETPLTSHGGANFSADELQPGQEVEIYVYPLENLFRSPKLRKFSGTFSYVTDEGLLAFDYDLGEHHRIRPGSSGGIVVDCKSQRVVGVVSAVDGFGEPTVFAVPVQSLVDFVYNVQPDLARRIFPPSLFTRSDISVETRPNRDYQISTSTTAVIMK